MFLLSFIAFATIVKRFSDDFNYLDATSNRICLSHIGFNSFKDEFVRNVIKPCSSVCHTSPVLTWSRPSDGVPFRPRPGRSMLTSFVAYLLLSIESNPGPSTVRFGSLNAGGANKKGALLDDTIRDNRLDVLAICESSISDEAPSAIRNDIAPSNFSVLHVHRPPSTDTGRRQRGGGWPSSTKTILSFDR